MRPIFVGGCERSGTTFLGAILGSSKHAIITPESHFKTTILSGRKNILQEPLKWEKLISDNFYFKLWNVEAPEVATGSSFSEYLIELAKQFQQKNQSEKSSPFSWIDHTPNNLKYATTLASFFPDALFIHIVRDGRGIYRSMKKTDWGAKNPRDGALLWMRKISHGLAAENFFHGERVIRIRYEDLLLQPEATLEVLKRFTGLNDISLQNDSMKNILPDYTKNQHALVGKKPEAFKATEWKQSLSQREIEIFEAEARDILSLLGYETIYGPYAKGITKKELWRNKIKSLMEYRLSLIRNTLRKNQSIRKLK